MWEFPRDLRVPRISALSLTETGAYDGSRSEPAVEAPGFNPANEDASGSGLQAWPAAEAASLLAFIPWPEGHGFYRRLALRGLHVGVGPTTNDQEEQLSQLVFGFSRMPRIL
jgi:hypothetical protein